MRRRLPPFVLFAVGFAAVSAYAAPAPEPRAVPAWSEPATGPGRFVAAHGRRALVMGYPASGLEIWAYPLQLLSGYQVRFVEAGRVEPLDGRLLLNRIETSPSEVVRVYLGPDFVVRERLFTPLDQPGAILTYEVEGRGDVRIETRFQPSLDLMWPGALGGQSVEWSEASNGYVEREPVHGFSAVIRSPQAVAHDPTGNSATGRPEGLALVLAPRTDADGVKRARLFVAADDPAAKGSEPLAQALERRETELREASAAHYARLLGGATEIVTPDPELNRTVAASVTALDQAWVCEPSLGCGEVAGYGPSRPGRRPQYAWFFAGDGLVAVEGLLAAGLYERAREELAFIARFQNRGNGMIWHEMSLSAPLIDWEKRYPYMFVHVDITLQYLATLGTYVRTTGDTGFVREHWAGIEAAWRYARSLVDAKTGLPVIPPGKEGQNEQTVLRDDIRLSSAWIDATEGFEMVARAGGRERLAAEAKRAGDAARAAVRANGWDAAQNFWLGGHTASGAPVHEQRPDTAGVLLQGVFTSAQADAALDRLAGPDFVTDWGVRSLSADDPAYDPNAYSQGSVWSLGTSSVATVYWKAHRPLTAWTAFHGLQAWSELDSPGHLHEVLAGDLFHPELESVPEQTWSSAGLLTGMVGGLLGLEVDARARRVTFAPHLPGGWNEVQVRRLRLGGSRLDLAVRETADAVSLAVHNDGAPATVAFAPELPLGARLLGAEADGKPIETRIEAHSHDQHARTTIVAGQGETRVTIRYSGGVRLVPLDAPPKPGEPSRNLKFASAEVSGGALKIDAWAADADHAAVEVDTAMNLGRATGAEVTPIAPGRWRLAFHTRTDLRTGRYVRASATVALVDNGPR